MENLKTRSAEPSKIAIPKWPAYAMSAASFFGFLDAAFLTVKHYLGTPLSCPFFGHCEKVLTSPYAVVWGIPIALLGAVYYLAVFILTVGYFDTKRERVILLAAKLSFVGFFASLVFLYLQLFVIKAICFYCVVSAATSTLLFIFGLFILKVRKKL